MPSITQVVLDDLTLQNLYFSGTVLPRLLLLSKNESKFGKREK